MRNVYTLRWEHVRVASEDEDAAAELFYETHATPLGREAEGAHGVEDEFYGWREDGRIVVVPWATSPTAA